MYEQFQRISRSAASGFAPRRLALAVTLGVLVGCASSLQQADRLFDERFYGEAAEAYEKALGAGGSGSAPELERVLFHLALIYALPESPVHDEERARELFEEIVRRFEWGAYRSQAVLVLELDRREKRLLGEAAERRQQVAALEGKSSSGSRHAERLRSTVLELQQDLERLDNEISECREQLEQLKAIDLGDGSS